MCSELRDWIRAQMASEEAALRAEHYRARLGLGNPGMPAELEQLERDRARLDTMTDAELRELGLLYADRAGYDQAWRP
ncbi:MAG TPA: hypothetical protein VIJ96_16135 [Acidothermaceae bacterium]